MLKSQGKEDPLFQRELQYQQRIAVRWLRRDNLAAVVTALLLIFPVAWTVPYGIAANHYFTLMAAEFTVWIFHALVVLRMVLISSSVITREYVGQNWELLILTGVSARQIILAKWRASLHQVRGWMLALGLLRLAIIPLCIFVFAMRSHLQRSAVLPLPAQSLIWLVIVMTVVLTFLDTACCTAIGLAASSLVTTSLSKASGVGVVVRFAPVVLFTSLLTYETYMRYRSVWLPWRWWAILADGGTGALIRLSMPAWMSRTEEPLAYELLGLGLVTLMLIGFTCGGLTCAYYGVRRRGALVESYSK